MFVAFSLENNFYGNYYRATYSEEYVQLNVTTGYLNPTLITSSTNTIPYQEYSGLEESKSDILRLYSSCIKDTLGWLEYLLENGGVDLKLADLGFVNYQ